MEKSKAPKKNAKAKKNIPSLEDFQDENEEELDSNEPTLYDLLNVSKTATTEEIKKSYKVLALKLHPDKNKEDPEATKNFQKLSEAYKILVDSEKRHLYDKTGSVEDTDINGFTEAYNYYRSMYPKIEEKDIEEFAKNYRFSQEETQDVMNYYNQYKGDVTLILESIILSENSDIDRFVAMIEDKIKSKELKKFANWDKTKKKIRLLPDESEEVQKQQEAQFKELAQNILTKYEKKNNFFDDLEKKYGGKKKANEYDIDEEEFQRIQSNMGKKGKGQIKRKSKGNDEPSSLKMRVKK